MRIWSCSWIAGICFASLAYADDPARFAFEKELAGDNSARAQVLEGPTGAEVSDQVHWLRGEIRVDGEWVPYRRVVDQGDRWAELHRYREERAKKGAGVDDQFFLADGSRQHKLFDEERAHLHGVLANDSDNEEARSRLGDRKVDGIWVTAEEAQLQRKSLDQYQSSLERWGKIVEKQAKLLVDKSPKRREAAQRALAEIREPDAIPVMEQALGRGNEQQQLHYLTWVCRLNSWMASASIARLAVASDSAVVRVRATKELKTRRLEEWVPTILGSMMTPVSIQTTMQQNGNWVFFSQHSLTETRDRQIDYHYRARFSPEILVLRVNRVTGEMAGVEVAQNPLLANASDGQRAFSVISEQAKEGVADQNRVIESWNDRCHRVLSEAIGISGLSTPQDWWAWWDDDQGYVFPSKEVLYAQYDEEWYVGRRRGPVRRPGTASPFMPVGGVVLSHSCFAAGTPVMTEFGSKPIESIVRGDRVLSQCIDTGELAFKPVYQTTIGRSPGSAIVKVGDDQMTCTSGHPFWVNGKGWRMARELEPGDRFHSVNGSVDVTGVDAGENVEVFNLVVGDFHTYFVGQNPVLTHDVTVRQPTDMALPGFAKETAAAVTSK